MSQTALISYTLICSAGKWKEGDEWGMGQLKVSGTDGLCVISLFVCSLHWWVRRCFVNDFI